MLSLRVSLPDVRHNQDMDTNSSKSKYRLQVKTTPNGAWKTIQRSRKLAELMAEMGKQSSLSLMLRVVLGKEQIAIEGGR